MAAAPACAFGAPATITATNAQVGVTPRFMGYNMGHYMPGSNTSAWTQYSGINAFRYWASPGDYEPTDDAAPFGDGVTSLTTFDNRKNLLRADLRGNPASNTYVNWTYFNTKFNATQSGRNKATLNYPLSELQKMGADVVMQITRSNASSYQIADWGGKWEQWQHYYAMAFYAAKNYDVQRYQMYNEPDLDTDLPRAEWVQRLQLASDAVKSAIEDVNTMTGKKLSWSMYAPVAGDQDGTVDTWGKDALVANRTDYGGRPTSYDIFDTYDVHRYNSLGSSFISDQGLFDSKIPVYNASGKNLPVTYTEFNRYSSGSFSKRSDNLDTPLIAAEFGSIIPGAMSQDVKGMYAFKFSQTVWTSSTTGNDEKQKTGFHYVSNTGPYNIQGSTRAAETMRLATKAFRGERPRLSQSVSADAMYDSVLTVDEGRGNYYFYSVNRNDFDQRDVTLNLSGLNIPAGTVVSYQEVSGNSYGAGRAQQFMTVPAASGGVQQVAFTQPFSSTWLLTIPKVPQTLLDLPATADAQVSHATPAVNFGLLTSAKVDRSASTADDDATYLKFNLQSTTKAKVGRAFLNVTGSNSTDAAPIHVYGILNDAWTETGINWSNAPDLANAADAQLANVGSDAFPVGQLTWNGVEQEWGIDVTDFIRKHPDDDVSFVLIRENRFDADPNNLRPGDTDISQVVVGTRESLSGAPHLSLYLADRPTHIWNTNFNGNMTSAGSWDAGAPSGEGSIALLGDFITSPHTATLDAAMSLGTLNFQSLNAYTVAGSQTLTMSDSAVNLASINVYQGAHTISVPVALSTPTDVYIGNGGSLTMTSALNGVRALTKSGAGSLILSAASPSFTGGATLNGGTVRLTAVDANKVSGLGTGPVVINNGAALVLENVALGASGHPGPDLTLNNGATLKAVGNSSFSKSGSPMIANGSVNEAVNVTLATTSAGDTLTIATAMRNVVFGSSFATINVAGPGKVLLQSGGLASSGTYSGNWSVNGGYLQLGGPNSGGEALNALGFKNGDAKQAVSVTINPGGTLLAGVNAPQPANVSTTPNFFRASIVMAGGDLAATGVDGNFGGTFSNLTSATSRILVYDPTNPSVARNINFVAGAASSLNNVSGLNWAGTVVVSAGSLTTGGALSINRTGGSVSVFGGSTLQIDSGAAVNAGGAIDPFTGGSTSLNIVNNQNATFRITAGSKRVGTLTGAGQTVVDAGASLSAASLGAGARLQINGKMDIRATGGLLNLATLSVGLNGALDLRDNDLILASGDYQTISDAVFNGYRDSVDTAATGIISSAGQTAPGHPILAVFDNALLHTDTWPFGSSTTVGSTAFLGRFTYLGDADLNGMVTPDDYGAVDSNLGQTVSTTGGMNWLAGDWTFDGAITPDDYIAIDSNLGLGENNPLTASGLAAQGAAAVPEPASVATLLGAACILIARRRRN
ncbi:MAG TPA: DNRLRE domain-containing protein [Tepidisphaeraceae bacterium]